MAKKIDLPHIFFTNASKGYVFKCKAPLPFSAKEKLVKDLTTQLHNGILIYEDGLLELVDSYDLNSTEIECESNPIQFL